MTYTMSTNPYASTFSKPKLTPAQRLEIQYRRFEGERSIDLAAEYGVSRSYIDDLAKAERPFA